MGEESALQGYKCVFLTRDQSYESVPQTSSLLGFTEFCALAYTNPAFWMPADVVYRFLTVKLDKNNISEIVELNNCNILVPFNYDDEFYSFVNAKKKLLMEKTIKNYGCFFNRIKLNLSEVIMRTGNKYLIIRK